MTPRRSEFGIYAVLILAAMAYTLAKRGEPPAQAPIPQPEAPAAPSAEAPPLPPAARGVLESVAMEPMRRGRPGRYSTGSAAAINGTGQWLTAHHVTRGCTAMALTVEGSEQAFAVTSVINHLGTDIALLNTRASETPVQMSARLPHYREKGFHVGFPQGQPTTVESRFLGSTTTTLGSDTLADRVRTQVDVWAEVERQPHLAGTLGGLSGGPALDPDGGIIGVTVAEEPRRGRVITIPAAPVRDMLKRAAIAGWGEEDSSGHSPVLSNANFANYGEQLRRSGSVARVWCFRAEDTRRRGW